MEEEDLKLVAIMANSVAAEQTEIARNSSDGFREGDRNPQNDFINRKKILLDAAGIDQNGQQHQAPYQPSVNDGFGEDLLLPPPITQPPRQQPTQPTVGGSVPTSFPFPPTVASSILKKLSGIEAAIAKIAEKIVELEKIQKSGINRND